MKRRWVFAFGAAAGIGAAALAVAGLVWWASGPSRKVAER